MIIGAGIIHYITFQTLMFPICYDGLHFIDSIGSRFHFGGSNYLFGVRGEWLTIALLTLRWRGLVSTMKVSEASLQ